MDLALVPICHRCLLHVTGVIYDGATSGGMEEMIIPLQLAVDRGNLMEPFLETKLHRTFTLVLTMNDSNSLMLCTPLVDTVNRDYNYKYKTILI